MPRRVPMAELAVELQVDLAAIEQEAAPLWPAAVRSHRRVLIDHCRRLARLVRAARLEARDIAGIADGTTATEEVAA